MKDRTMSSKHDRHDSKRNSNRSRDSDQDAESYKHVLKERHYKDDEKNKKRDKDRSKDLKHSSSHSHKRRRSHSPHQSSHHKPATKSKAVVPDKNHKSHKYQDNDISESYEELSRRKRKLESELRALDLEEAAEREAENKKTCRDRLGKSTSQEGPRVKIKKEPVSDDEKDHRKSSSDKRNYRKAQNNERTVKISSNNERTDKKASKSKSQHAGIKSEKEKHKKYDVSSSSSSSDEEKVWGKREPKPTNKDKPNFATSGRLAEETNTYNGVVIKYNEPSEARKPKRRWRLYPFKGDSDLPFIPIHRQSAYLFGRTRLIADIPIDHPSCSKQHAVLQFRLVPYKREDGTTGRRVRPYIIDLESSNGTFVNNNRVDPRCYVELVEKDVIKFGYSSREYVILHEESKNSEEDDDVVEGEVETKS